MNICLNSVSHPKPREETGPLQLRVFSGMIWMKMFLQKASTVAELRPPFQIAQKAQEKIYPSSAQCQLFSWVLFARSGAKMDYLWSLYSWYKTSTSEVVRTLLLDCFHESMLCRRSQTADLQSSLQWIRGDRFFWRRNELLLTFSKRWARSTKEPLPFSPKGTSCHLCSMNSKEMRLRTRVNVMTAWEFPELVETPWSLSAQSDMTSVALSIWHSWS